MKAMLTDGTLQTFIGCYNLHISQPSIQATPPFAPLGIVGGSFKQVSNNTDVASMLATAALPIYVSLVGIEPGLPLATFGVAVTALIVFTHRSNIARMRRGTEPRARRLWLFGRHDR